MKATAVMPDHELHLGLEEDGEGFTTLTLVPNPEKPRGGVVVLDEWLIDQIHLAMDRVEAAPPEKGFILASGSERVFTAGADLEEFESKDDPALFAYLEKAAAAFMRITRLDCTSAAVIGGSALGGGLEIAMHCDGLIGLETGADEKPYLVGLPEAGLGLCPGWGGTQMLPARIPAPDAILATAKGRVFKSNGLPNDLFDVVVARRQDLPAAARDWMGLHQRHRRWELPRSIQDMSTDVLIVALDEIADLLPDTEAARAVVECVRSGNKDGFLTALETERRLLVSLRHTPTARERLADFFAGQKR